MNKSDFGRVCEDFVGELIKSKTQLEVINLNDRKVNHPKTDLAVINLKSGEEYQVSVKAKKGNVWPAVKGIDNDDHFIIFVDIYRLETPAFYVLSNHQWQSVLKNILPEREGGAEIKDGALEWNWEENGKAKKYRGSQLRVEDISDYVNNWSVLPSADIA
ncbi:hypothetical protein EAG18_10915 [Pseudoalteromonas sp. J010]|uniref:hypothetical protein n=1 Tax=Pseudoalteromonas sp. J010 TaxID=998465 RepID=UPI000F64ED3E|nr:hypothetical protein [Pseudoalteromonas sp. J010]RRS08698.1 hypothetical protein EAG18_10915 [Pseudoalteromonas sp. J010]